MFKFLLSLTLFSICGIILFPVLYWLLPENLFGGIVFYKGLLAAFILFSVTFISAFTFLLKKRSSSFTEAATAISLLNSSFAAVAFNVIFLITFPVTFDRSVSTYLLGQIHKNKTISTSALEEIFINDYVISREAIKRRINEQELTGNIIINADDTVQLTQQGERFIEFEKLIKKIFLLRDRSAD